MRAGCLDQLVPGNSRDAGDIPPEDYVWQHAPILEGDITGEIFLRLAFDDEMDLFMADGGRYRRRRFATFRVAGESILRKPATLTVDWGTC